MTTAAPAHYSRRELTREIAEQYARIGNQPVVRRADLAAAVLTDWPKTDIEQDKWCRAEVVHEAVQRYIRDRKRMEEPDPKDVDQGKQGELPEVEIRPGYARLQTSYCIQRDNDLAIVKLEYMSSAEREEKARAMEKCAAGLMEHADELRRFDRENPKP